MSDEKDNRLSGTAYVTVYHTVNIHIGLGLVAIPCIAIVAIIALLKIWP